MGAGRGGLRPGHRSHGGCGPRRPRRLPVPSRHLAVVTGERVPVSQTHDYRHFYRGLHGSPSVCHILVYCGSGDATLVIASELPDNPGTSITNAAEGQTTEMGRRHCPDPNERII
jgi:hypothetical protein